MSLNNQCIYVSVYLYYMYGEGPDHPQYLYSGVLYRESGLCIVQCTNRAVCSYMCGAHGQPCQRMIDTLEDKQCMLMSCVYMYIEASFL